MPTEAEKRLHRCCFSGHRPEKLDAPEEEVNIGAGILRIMNFSKIGLKVRNLQHEYLRKKIPLHLPHILLIKKKKNKKRTKIKWKQPLKIR